MMVPFEVQTSDDDSFTFGPERHWRTDQEDTATTCKMGEDKDGGRGQHKAAGHRRTPTEIWRTRPLGGRGEAGTSPGARRTEDGGHGRKARGRQRPREDAGGISEDPSRRRTCRGHNFFQRRGGRGRRAGRGRKRTQKKSKRTSRGHCHGP